jgi:hypothetical protein
MRVNSVPFYDNEEAKPMKFVDQEVRFRRRRHQYIALDPGVSGLNMADFLSQPEALWNDMDESTDAWLQVSADLWRRIDDPTV